MTPGVLVQISIKLAEIARCIRKHSRIDLEKATRYLRSLEQLFGDNSRETIRPLISGAFNALSMGRSEEALNLVLQASEMVDGALKREAAHFGFHAAGLRESEISDAPGILVETARGTVARSVREKRLRSLIGEQAITHIRTRKTSPDPVRDCRIRQLKEAGVTNTAIAIRLSINIATVATCLARTTGKQTIPFDVNGSKPE